MQRAAVCLHPVLGPTRQDWVVGNPRSWIRVCKVYTVIHQDHKVVSGACISKFVRSKDRGLKVEPDVSLGMRPSLGL